jgi:hypothetical protein
VKNTVSCDKYKNYMDKNKKIIEKTKYDITFKNATINMKNKYTLHLFHRKSGHFKNNKMTKRNKTYIIM